MDPSRSKNLIGHGVSNLKDMISSTPSCLKIINNKGELLSMNPRGLSLIGADDEESAIGADVYSLLTPEHRDAFIKFNEKVCNGDKSYLVFKILSLDGVER